MKRRSWRGREDGACLGSPPIVCQCNWLTEGVEEYDPTPSRAELVVMVSKAARFMSEAKIVMLHFQSVLLSLSLSSPFILHGCPPP